MSKDPIPEDSGAEPVQEQVPPAGSGIGTSVGAGVAVTTITSGLGGAAEVSGVFVGASVGIGVRVGRRVAVGVGVGGGVAVAVGVGGTGVSAG